MEQFIYFIQVSDGAIKIGITKNLLDRINVLQTANHQKLRLLRAISGTLSDETKLLQRFIESNIRGEWFHPSPNLLSYIEALPTNLSESFNNVADKPCECGNLICHIKFIDNQFTGCCRRCLMIADGRMKKLIERVRNTQKKEKAPCKICSDNNSYLRRGRCTACSAYFRRTGHDRTDDLINRTKSCINCGRQPKQLTKKLCPKCYYHHKKKIRHSTGSSPAVESE